MIVFTVAAVALLLFVMPMILINAFGAIGWVIAIAVICWAILGVATLLSVRWLIFGRG